MNFNLKTFCNQRIDSRDFGGPFTQDFTKSIKQPCDLSFQNNNPWRPNSIFYFSAAICMVIKIRDLSFAVGRNHV